MQAVRVVLSVALGSLYSFLIFAGIGLWMPFIFLPIIFFACCFIAWRNVSLWYEQGTEFEEELAEAEHRRHCAPPNVFGEQNVNLGSTILESGTAETDSLLQR